MIVHMYTYLGKQYAVKNLTLCNVISFCDVKCMQNVHQVLCIQACVLSKYATDGNACKEHNITDPFIEPCAQVLLELLKDWHM